MSDMQQKYSQYGDDFPPSGAQYRKSTYATTVPGYEGICVLQRL